MRASAGDVGPPLATHSRWHPGRTKTTIQREMVWPRVAHTSKLAKMGTVMSATLLADRASPAGLSWVR